MTARTCLSTTKFLQFQTWWQGEDCQQAQTNAAANPPLNITVEQLMGSGEYQEVQRQLQFDDQLISQIRLFVLGHGKRSAPQDSPILLLLMYDNLTENLILILSPN